MRLSTMRGRFLAAGLVIFGLVLAGGLTMWIGLGAVDRAGDTALRYAGQSTYPQMLIKDINQLVTTEGAKAVRARMEKPSDPRRGAGGGAFRRQRTPRSAKKVVSSWQAIKGDALGLLAEPKISADNDAVLIKMVKLVAALDGIADEASNLASMARTNGAETSRRTLLTVGRLCLHPGLRVRRSLRPLSRSAGPPGAEPGEAVRIVREIAGGNLALAIDPKAGGGDWPARFDPDHAGPVAGHDLPGRADHRRNLPGGPADGRIGPSRVHRIEPAKRFGGRCFGVDGRDDRQHCPDRRKRQRIGAPGQRRR